MPTTRATTYTIYPDGFEGFVHTDKHLWTLTVEERDPEKGLWYVRDSFSCLDRNGVRDNEPQPSSRTQKWLARHGFPLDLALAIAERHVNTIVWNGFTAQEASDWVAARNAARGEQP